MRYQAPRRSSDGFTLIELMVALLISVFLLGGLMAINQSNRGAFTMQANLVQQTDEQRFAMTMLTEVVQSAGYFDNPATNTATAVFPIVGVWVNSGQIIFGTSGTKGASDTLSTRFFANSASPLLLCDGTAPTTVADSGWEMQLSVSAAGQLLCSITGGAPIALVDNVQNMSILYGVHANPATLNGSIDSYLTAAQMSANDWMNVLSVRVVLSFRNTAPGAGQPPQIQMARSIAVMARC